MALLLSAIMLLILPNFRFISLTHCCNSLLLSLSGYISLKAERKSKANNLYIKTIDFLNLGFGLVQFLPKLYMGFLQ